MTERVIRIGIPPELAQELKEKDGKNDWVGRMLCKDAAGNVISLLIEAGEIDLGDNVDVEFRSDPTVNINDGKRIVWISDIVLDDETEKDENARAYYYQASELKNHN